MTCVTGRGFLLWFTVLCLLACRVPAQADDAAKERDMEPETNIETVETDGFSMDYFRFGRGDQTLVILPGLSVESVMKYADAVAEAYAPLTEDFTVYVFDRRKELPAVYTVRDMARDTAEALRALGLGPVNLFGASQGGMIAMTVAIEDPDLVSRLILGSTAAAVPPERYREIENWIQLAGTGDAEGLYLAFGEAIYPPAVFEQSRALLTESAKGVSEKDLKRFVILAEGIQGFDVEDRLAEIACPVLILGSRDDRVLGGEASERIAARLQGRADTELYMYDGYGHAAYDTAPDYKERILHFLLDKQ